MCQYDLKRKCYYAIIKLQNKKRLHHNTNCKPVMHHNLKATKNECHEIERLDHQPELKKYYNMKPKPHNVLLLLLPLYHKVINRPNSFLLLYV